jgi:hypothetical protein
MDEIDELKNAIRRLHGCEADHIESVSVKEVFNGQTVWEGEVEVFSVRGHRKATRCYAWAHAEDGAGKRYVAVLELPPVDSPRAAVRAAIVAEARGKEDAK